MSAFTEIKFSRQRQRKLTVNNLSAYQTNQFHYLYAAKNKELTSHY